MTDALPENLLPGAEPWSHDGGPAGALVLHGFTGNPASMRGVAEALADAGFSVEMPLLPGHGTVVDDMIPTGFSDWLAAAEDALTRLRGRCPKVVVVGLSMGGALTAWLGAEHPDVAGLVAINAIVSEPDGMRALVEQLEADGVDRFGGIGSDIKKEGVEESAYADTPVAPLRSLLEAAAELDARLDRITAPLLVITSREDHVVPPSNSDLLAERARGPVERVWAENSYHVVTMDNDAELVETTTVDFVRRVTAG